MGHKFFRRIAKDHLRRAEFDFCQKNSVPIFVHPDGKVRVFGELVTPQIELIIWFDFYNWALKSEHGPCLSYETAENDDMMDEAIEKWKDDIVKRSQKSNNKDNSFKEN